MTAQNKVTINTLFLRLLLCGIQHLFNFSYQLVELIATIFNYLTYN